MLGQAIALSIWLRLKAALSSTVNRSTPPSYRSSTIPTAS